MRLATASDISDTGCGNGKVQSSLPPGRGAGAKASCTVWVSVATGAMASTAGTPEEPSSTSTLLSVMKRRVFFTAPMVSDPSSSTMSLIFSPAIRSGQRSSEDLTGSPSEDSGPVSDRFTPILMSAWAAPASASNAAAKVLRMWCFKRSPCGVVCRALGAQR